MSTIQHENGIVEVNSRNDFHELDNGRGGFGSFQHALMDAIRKADSSNINRLYKGFPDLVTQYLNYVGNQSLLTVLEGFEEC